MKPEAQIIAIAEFCGAKWTVTRARLGFPEKVLCFGKYRRSYSWDEQMSFDVPEQCPFFPEYGLLQVPYYLNDLNAMHQAEKTLPRELHWRYQHELWNVFRPHMNLEKSLLGYLCAEASHRAEAFLRTIEKWTDEKLSP